MMLIYQVPPVNDIMRPLAIVDADMMPSYIFSYYRARRARADARVISRQRISEAARYWMICNINVTRRWRF